MDVQVCETDQQLAEQAARLVAASAEQSVSQRGRFLLAVSGGSTPWQMLRALARLPVPWDKVHVFQVDERVAPAGSEERNLTHLRESLREASQLDERRVHAMPVEHDDLRVAARDYQQLLRQVAGSPPVLDLVHLGLGADGHTASLVPGDAALEESSAEITECGEYQGRRRLTMTYPLLNRSRQILWLVTGGGKAPMLARLVAGDSSIPAGRVAPEAAVVLADPAAASQLPPSTTRRS